MSLFWRTPVFRGFTLILTLQHTHFAQSDVLIQYTFNNTTSPLYEVHTDLQYIHIIKNIYIYRESNIFLTKFSKCIFKLFYNFSHCNGLLIKYAVMDSVYQYLIVKFPFSDWSVNKYFLCLNVLSFYSNSFYRFPVVV